VNPLIVSWLTGPDGLGTRLRAVRDRAGIAGKDLAESAGWDPPRVSKLELGKQMPTADDVRTYVALCGGSPELLAELLDLQVQAQTEKLTFRQRSAHGQAPTQRTYNELVAASKVVRHFETVFVPGLIQVPDYARRVFVEQRQLHDLEVDDVEAAVAERLQRQQFVYDSAKRFEFLLAEPVLRWLVAPAPVMRAQLDRLLAAIGLANVEIGVVPLGVELTWTPQHSFQMYDDVAVVETFLGEVTYEGAAAGQFARAMELLWSEAVTGDDARRLILAAAEALPPT
jgi:transcriptional regulator with XRE-family HTH domain